MLHIRQGFQHMLAEKMYSIHNSTGNFLISRNLFTHIKTDIYNTKIKVMRKLSKLIKRYGIMPREKYKIDILFNNLSNLNRTNRNIRI